MGYSKAGYKNEALFAQTGADSVCTENTTIGWFGAGYLINTVTQSAPIRCTVVVN